MGPTTNVSMKEKWLGWMIVLTSLNRNFFFLHWEYYLIGGNFFQKHEKKKQIIF